jgi:hypothetical protein
MRCWLTVAIVLLSQVAGAQPAEDPKDEARRLFEEGHSEAAATPPDWSKICDMFRRSFALDPEPGTELNLALCYEHQGLDEEAVRWYRDARRRFALTGDWREQFAGDCVEALEERIARARAAAAAETAPPADSDDHRHAWRIAFWSAVAVGAVSLGVDIYGRHEINDATDQLCQGGAYRTAGCRTFPNITQQQVASLNAQGDRGQQLTIVGGIATALAVTTAGVALYEGYVRERPTVAVAPLVAPGTGGAVFRLSW